VFVPDVAAQRGAVAMADETTVMVIGGAADAPIPTSPFEYWFAAEPAYRAGDYDRAVAIASEGLAEWPTQGALNYQLACYHALADRPQKALEHLAIAVENDPRTAGWAQDDEDLESIRADPSFPKAG
jgi:tetratricopeptide (TPR) repeat protein